MSSPNIGSDSSSPFGSSFERHRQNHGSGFRRPDPSPQAPATTTRAVADHGSTHIGLAALAVTGFICVGAYVSDAASLLLFVCSMVVCAVAVLTTSRRPSIGLLPRALIGGSFVATVATAWAVSEGLAL